MPINPRGNKWELTIHQQGARFRRSFDSLDEALAIEKVAKEMLRRGASITEIRANCTSFNHSTPGSLSIKKPQTLGELWEVVKANHYKGSKGEATSLPMGDNIVDLLGEDISYKDITGYHLDVLKKHFEGLGNSANTIKRKLAVLTKTLSYAADQNWLVNVPRRPKLKIPQHRTRKLTYAEEAQLIHYLKVLKERPEVADLVELCINTGMRRSEAVYLTGKNVIEGAIKLSAEQTKSHKERVIPLTQRAMEIVSERVEKYGRERLFPGLHADLPTRWVRKARIALGFGDDTEFVLHATRHTFCSRLADEGQGGPVIQALAGHADLTTTQLYIHTSAESQKEAILALEKGRRQQEKKKKKKSKKNKKLKKVKLKSE